MPPCINQQSRIYCLRESYLFQRNLPVLWKHSSSVGSTWLLCALRNIFSLTKKNAQTLIMFFNLLILSLLPMFDCCSNLTEFEQALIDSLNEPSRLEISNNANSSSPILCHCRYDFSTMYFDAVAPFVLFATTIRESLCSSDKTCEGAVCVTVGCAVEFKTWD